MNRALRPITPGNLSRRFINCEKIAIVAANVEPSPKDGGLGVEWGGMLHRPDNVTSLLLNCINSTIARSPIEI